MQGILFRPDIWLAKKRVLEQYGEAQTRRLMKPQPKGNYVCKCPGNDKTWSGFEGTLDDEHKRGWIPYEPVVFPRYRVGPIYYVKEAWAVIKLADIFNPRDIPLVNRFPIWYQGQPDWQQHEINPWPEGNRGKWRSPLFMPAWAARSFVQFTDVKPERLQNINTQRHDDVQKEGYPFGFNPDELNENPVTTFARIWNSLNPTYPWESNCWVWRYVFKQVERPAEE